jgi:predicted nucleotidyltransferase
MSLGSIVDILKTYFLDKDVAAVYLFGSYVKMKERKSSDLDIGILHKTNIDPLKKFESNLDFAVQLEEITGITVDLFDLEKVNTYLLHQMMLNKILILDKDTKRRVAFEVARRKEYFDRKSFYKIYHEQALRRLERRAVK